MNTKARVSRVMVITLTLFVISLISSFSIKEALSSVSSSVLEESEGYRLTALVMNAGGGPASSENVNLFDAHLIPGKPTIQAPLPLLTISPKCSRDWATGLKQVKMSSGQLSDA